MSDARGANMGVTAGDPFGSLAAAAARAQQLADAVDSARTASYETTAGSGTITVRANGAGALTAVEIDPLAFDRLPHAELVAALTDGVQRALGEAQAATVERLTAVAGSAGVTVPRAGGAS